MRISASEFILFCNPPLENVRRLSSIVPEVELMMDGDAWEHDQNGWEAQVKMLKGINVPMSAHGMSTPPRRCWLCVRPRHF